MSHGSCFDFLLPTHSDMPAHSAYRKFALARAFQVARSPCMLFLGALSGAILGSIISGHMAKETLHPYSLAATYTNSGGESEACPEWTISALTQKRMQRDYCIRRFTGEVPEQDLVKTKLLGPDQTHMDFIVYDGNDIVSGAIRSNGHWEHHLSTALVMVLSKVAEDRGLPHERVHLLDIGGNVGAHTVYAQAAGFSVVTFEPLPQNEAIIRTNLCFNDPKQERVTLFTNGLGSEPTLCKQFSAPNYNRGNGVVNCNGSIPQHPDGQLIYRGQMEVLRLDDVLLPCKNGTQLPPDIVFGAMKMDVEGFEPEVLKGGETFFTKALIPYIVFEIGRMPESRRQAVLQFFYGLGYQASTSGFFQGLGQPRDLPGTEDVYLVLLQS